MAGYFAQDVLPMLAALAFAIFDFFQLADANVLEFLNFAADLASTLSGVVNVIKDGSILFGWGGSGFQNVMTILTTLDKGASAIVQFARAILGGAYALAMFFNPASAIENMVKVVIKKFRFQVIEALLGGVIFGGVDTAYATVSGLQALSIVVNSAPTKDLPEWCNRLGLQC